MHARVSRPTRYVMLTPILFNFWEDWARAYEEEKNSLDYTIDKQQNSTIRPLGEKISPDWMKYEFKNLEEFYQYYIELLNVGDKNAG